MDLVVHFPTGDIKRNFNRPTTGDLLDRFLGTPSWRQRIGPKADIGLLVEVLKEQLGKLGYTGANVRSVPITNSTNAVLYHLIFASKDELGDKLWNSVTANAPSGQRGWNF
jgi:three-Cys-motif partner protein